MNVWIRMLLPRLERDFISSLHSADTVQAPSRSTEW